MMNTFPLVPAKAGTQGRHTPRKRFWTPAFAGVSGDK
jgi:hypothetical protein